MNQMDIELEQLRQQLARGPRLEAMLRELHSRQKELLARTAELNLALQKEQEDVQRLHGRSLTAFFYQIIGKKEEQLDKEHCEAFAAQAKYDAASRELQAVEQDIQQYTGQKAQLAAMAEQYQTLLDQKAEQTVAYGGAAGRQIQALRQELSHLEQQKRELQEAITAGNAALGLTEQILSHLDSADGWATWDVLGGGLVADLAKHSELDDAQALVEKLQIQLTRFRTELADVNINGDIPVSIDGFMRFADYFFDGIFADWSVKGRIENATHQVWNTKKQIKSMLAQLNDLADTMNREAEGKKEALEEVIRTA